MSESPATSTKTIRGSSLSRIVALHEDQTAASAQRGSRCPSEQFAKRSSTAGRNPREKPHPIGACRRLYFFGRFIGCGSPGASRKRHHHNGQWQCGPASLAPSSQSPLLREDQEGLASPSLGHQEGAHLRLAPLLTDVKVTPTQTASQAPIERGDPGNDCGLGWGGRPHRVAGGRAIG